MTEIEKYIQAHFGIPNKSLETVAALFHEDQLSKNEFYIKSGQYCQKLSFIKTGFLRIYANTERKEVTQWISYQGYFLTDLASLMFHAPARWNIQALTDCELYTISSEDYRKIGHLVPEWDKLEKLFLSKCFVTLEERVFSFLSMTAEERYMALFNHAPELFNQVPLIYLASMLGMTPETLSRIRKKLLNS
jgi:CRP-like cAMP-binding protein